MRRTKPRILLAYEALLRNIDQSYRDRESILVEYYKQGAGYYGERQLDYKLSLLPKEYVTLPDIRLENPITAFQMDAIIITPKMIVIAESKFLKGELEYSAKTRQLVQYDEGRVTAYKDPILQASMQKRHLSNWLAHHGYNIPIEAVVVSTNERAILKNIDQDLAFQKCFLTLENLIYQMEEIYDAYDDIILAPAEVKKLTYLIKNADQPLFVDLLEKHQVGKHQLITGIRCRVCHLLLQRIYGNWKCLRCNMTDKDAHKQKIYDYFLLLGDRLANEECRKWLGLGTDKKDVTKRLLQSVNLDRHGVKSATKYYAPKIEHYPQNSDKQQRR